MFIEADAEPKPIGQRRWRATLLLLLSATLVIGAAIVVRQQTADLLAQEAQAKAATLARNLNREIEGFGAKLAAGGWSPDDLSRLHPRLHGDHIQGYRLFDLQGRVRYSAPPAAGLDQRSAAVHQAHVQPVLEQAASGHGGQVIDGAGLMTEAIMPLVADGRLIGLLEADIDQGALQSKLARLWWASIVCLAAVVLLGTIPQAWLGWRRRQAQHLAEQRLAALTWRDPLTALPNRARMNHDLRLALQDAAAIYAPLALLTLDLDRFKAINDDYGQAFADGVLIELAERLSLDLGPDLLIARVAGDEFAVLQWGRPQPAAAMALADQLREIVRRPFWRGAEPITIDASVGIAIAREGSDCVDDLLARANLALRRAKEQGRGRHRCCEPGMELQSRIRRTLEADLRHALATDQLTVHYQPQIELTSGRIRGFEALLRWQHPRHGWQPPADVVALADAAGLSLELGAWVLRRAARDASCWLGEPTVSVNVCAAQMRAPDLVEQVTAAYVGAGFPPARLELEVTEGNLIDDSPAALDRLRQLKALGVQIAMDDFGTGYSSLRRLRCVPFNRLKIDRSFVMGLEHNHDDVAIVRAIIGLAGSLGMGVVAEGIETPAQLDFLQAEGCECGQGFYFSRAVSACEAARLCGRLWQWPRKPASLPAKVIPLAAHA